MDLSSPHTDPLGPDCPTRLQASALGPECLMGVEPNPLRAEGPTRMEPNPLRSECPARAKANLTIADRGTGAEAHPMVAVSSGAIGQPPHVPARIGVRHPRDRPARSDIRHARRHGLRVGHSGWGLAVAYARDVGREGVRWRDRRVTRWAVVEAHPSDPEGGAHKPACNR